MPVEVLLRFEGGQTYRSHWDGEARWTRFRVASRARASLEAIVDPDEKILLDADRTNNGRAHRGRPARGDALDRPRASSGSRTCSTS